MTDPIADMLTRIRNAQMVLKEKTLVPYSDIKYRIGKILEEQGCVGEVKKLGRKDKKMIRIELKYDKDKSPAIRGIKRVSKQGQRIYISAKDIRPIQQGYGFSIISTPKGIMAGKEAKKNNVGGEYICKVW